MDARKYHASRGEKPRPIFMYIEDVHNSPSLKNKMLRWGWLSPKGYPLQWKDHQRPNHNDQFDEPRERKQRRKKFVPKRFAPQEPR